MNTFSPYEISRAHAIAAELNAVFDQIHSTDHALERDRLAEQFSDIIQPGNDNSVVNLARSICEAKVHAAVEEFLQATQRYYSDSGRARRAAETTDLVKSLQHEHSSLTAPPSPLLALQLKSIFDEFTAANPLPEPQAPKETTP